MITTIFWFCINHADTFNETINFSSKKTRTTKVFPAVRIPARTAKIMTAQAPSMASNNHYPIFDMFCYLPISSSILAEQLKYLQWNVDTVLQWKSWHQIESLKQQCRQFGYCLSYLVDFSGDERKISKKFTSYLSRKLSQMGGGAVAQTRPESANASPAKFNHLSPDQETDQQGKYNYVAGSMV